MGQASCAGVHPQKQVTVTVHGVPWSTGSGSGLSVSILTSTFASAWDISNTSFASSSSYTKSISSPSMTAYLRLFQSQPMNANFPMSVVPGQDLEPVLGVQAVALPVRGRGPGVLSREPDEGVSLLRPAVALLVLYPHGRLGPPPGGLALGPLHFASVRASCRSPLLRFWTMGMIGTPFAPEGM